MPGDGLENEFRKNGSVECRILSGEWKYEGWNGEIRDVRIGSNDLVKIKKRRMRATGTGNGVGKKSVIE